MAIWRRTYAKGPLSEKKSAAATWAILSVAKVLQVATPYGPGETPVILYYNIVIS